MNIFALLKKTFGLQSSESLHRDRNINPDPINIIKGPKGSINLTERFLNPRGYSLVPGSGRFSHVDHEKKQVLIAVNHYHPLILLHEIGHVLEDDTNMITEGNEQLMEVKRMSLEMLEIYRAKSSNKNYCYENDPKLLPYSEKALKIFKRRAYIQERIERRAWLTALQLAKEIEKEIGVDLRKCLPSEDESDALPEKIFPAIAATRQDLKGRQKKPRG